jgi:hypothetical protein
MNFRITCIFLSILLVNCSVGPGKYKSNDTPDEIPHVEILSDSDYSVTIGHNLVGEQIALLYAYEKCASIGKKSIYLSTSKQYGSEIISTWKCVDLDFL